jgi:hypothetical protein
MNMRLSAAVLSLLATMPAMAATYLSAQRGALVSAYVGSFSDWTAVNPPSTYSEFHANINRKVDIASGYAESQAWQDSSLTSTGIFMHAGSYSNATPVDQCAGGMSETMATIAFTIAVPTAYTLQGFVNASGDTEARVTIKDKNDVIVAGVENVNGWIELNGSGTLPPGDYVFHAAGNSFLSQCAPTLASSSVTFIAALNFAESPQCGADFNSDGFLDYTDFDDFVVAFEAGSAASDFNGDGFLDFTDFDDFVGAFESGC